MKSVWSVFVVTCCLGVAAMAAAENVVLRTRESFNRDWRFASDQKPITNERIVPNSTSSPSVVDFDDSTWRKLDVPHDWGIEGPFRDDLENSTGKLPWKSIGWYRKHFVIPAADQGKRIFIDFDGAMANAKVWLNGQYVGTWPYGYNAFRLDLTPFLKYGAENVLSVQLDTTHWGSRWYPGAGIYRNVWLVKTSSVHVGHWGAYVTTPLIGKDTGHVKLVATVDNQGSKPAKTILRAEVFELTPDGAVGRKAAESAAVEKAIGAAPPASLS